MTHAKQLEWVHYTRVKKSKSQTENHQFALTDHVVACNHIIDWEGVKLPAKDRIGQKEVSEKPSASGRQASCYQSQ